MPLVEENYNTGTDEGELIVTSPPLVVKHIDFPVIVSCSVYVPG